MSDNLQIRQPQDRLRINVHEPWELNWWTREFGVTRQQLEHAVRQVGVMTSAVRQYLGK
ncbi:DUF3606 domain-containing protein [Sphingomonas sp. OTU376]|uniref:DUF3606 domain-containing protein n=1 Tax=Sphingomonas sp. OTU376 TaxID=3043863 RepID=UPI00313BDABE